MSLSPAAFSAASYDYVIAGGGTAGLVLAARLTENPAISVAVVEAGEDRSGDLSVNAWGLTASMLGNPLYDWAFSTTPQTSDDNRVITWPRGKMLGGSSGTNFWYWNRASQEDIDDFAELGNDGWTWADLLPYYLKSEKYFAAPAQQAKDLQIDYFNPALHGTSGPIDTSYPPIYNIIGESWNPTYKNLGLASHGDPYGGNTTGSFTTLISQNLQNVSRSFATTGYYKPNAHRPNLKVLTGALVTKVRFATPSSKGAPLVATGVDFTVNGTLHTVKAKKEVILSAGVTQSPQLLELSGIGGAALLKSLGIKVLVANDNVGENLQDHQFTSLGFTANPGVPTADVLNDPAVLQQAITDYTTNRTGLLTEATCSTAYLSFAQLLGLSSTPPMPASASAQSASAQFAAPPGRAKQYELVLKKLLDPQQPFAQEIYTPQGLNFPPVPGAFITLFGLLSHPFSRGSIHINSTDPTAYPVINPQFLSNPLDVDILGTIALHLQKVARTPPLSDLLMGNGTVYAPGYSFITPANVSQHVRNTLGEFQHPTGTCAMEPQDQGGVVDPRLIVYGTQNLRVVDASVIPLQPVGTIQSLVYAIAEKAADIIKQAQ
ncbi:MAG: hypothetical protein M1838_003712 [Thelocarpon superellum]|nr:MAG: hypothetical protein M1838_003712 [Thelocarpon superellum]